MKRLLFVCVALFVSSVFAQSPTIYRNMNLAGAHSLYNPPNAWYGSDLTLPVLNGENIDLSQFGVKAEFVIDFTQFNLGREWNLLTYSTLGLPNYNRVNVFNNVVSAQDGISVGLQAFTIFGDLNEEALTAYLNTAVKLNTFGSADVNSYRLGAGLEVSLRAGGLPLVLNVSPAYVILNSQAKFASVQSEVNRKGFWTSEAFVIVPVGNKLGLLTQATFTKYSAPQVRAGIILATGL